MFCTGNGLSVHLLRNCRFSRGGRSGEKAENVGSISEKTASSRYYQHLWTSGETIPGIIPPLKESRLYDMRRSLPNFGRLKKSHFSAHQGKFVEMNQYAQSYHTYHLAYFSLLWLNINQILRYCVLTLYRVTLLQVLVALRILATGSFQRPVGNDMFLAVSQASVSYALRKVIPAIVDLYQNTWINFPSTPEERKKTSLRYVFQAHLRSRNRGLIGELTIIHDEITKNKLYNCLFTKLQYKVT